MIRLACGHAGEGVLINWINRGEKSHSECFTFQNCFQANVQSPLGPEKFQTLRLFLHGNAGYSFHGNKPLQGLRMRALEQLWTKRPGWGKGSAGSPMNKHVQCWDLNNNNRVVAKQNKYWLLGNYFITLFTALLCWSMSVS